MNKPSGCRSAIGSKNTVFLPKESCFWSRTKERNASADAIDSLVTTTMGDNNKDIYKRKQEVGRALTINCYTTDQITYNEKKSDI